MSRSPFFRHCRPGQQSLSARQVWLSAVCASIAMGLVGTVSQYSLTGYSIHFMAASMGASAVLLFVRPASSMSTPWSFVAGHLVSAFIGICCAKWIPDFTLAAGIAIGSSILAMFYLNCLHPPGGAAALLAIFGGDSVRDLGFQFLLSPLLLNIFLMLACALAYWRIAGVFPQQISSEGET